MRKLSIGILAFSFLFILFAALPARSQVADVNIYVFYGDGCPHCAKEETFLDSLSARDPGLKVRRFEVWRDRENADLLVRIAKEIGTPASGVPFLVIGDRAVVGYYNAETTGREIIDLIELARAGGCRDIVAELLNETGPSGGATCEHACAADDNECRAACGCQDNASTTGRLVNLPFIGAVDPGTLSLPLLTVIVGGLDGFNPCAMWVLLFLINLLLGETDRTRRWVLGAAFIFVSGLVYYLFLSAWLNVFLFVGFISAVRILVGTVAIGSGAWQLRRWWKNREGGCDVVEEGERRQIFTRLKRIVSERNFFLALGGIVVLAASVNLIELVCSAGLPAVYTQVLSLSDLPWWQYQAYLALYILIYMLDDLLIFFVAMRALELKAVGGRYERFVGLIGGILILLLGLALIFRPGLVMF